MLHRFMFLIIASAVVSLLETEPSGSDHFENVRLRLVNGSSIRATIDAIDEQGEITGSALVSGVKLDQIVNLLNVKDESRFLFSGGNIQNKPIDLNNGTYTPPTVPPFPAVANTDWYGGDNVTQQARIDEDFVIDYGVKANDPAIERVIRAFEAISEITFSSPPSAAEVAAISDAIALLTVAIDTPPVGEATLNQLFAGVELNRVLLRDVDKKHENFAAFAGRTIIDIEQVDTAEAITRLNIEQVTLEASFATISRVQNLSLVNFL